MMLPTYKRQLMLIQQDEADDAQTDIKIWQHHHPILVLNEVDKGRINQKVVCKDRHGTFELNTFSSVENKWFRPLNTNSLFLEKYVILCHSTLLSRNFRIMSY